MLGIGIKNSILFLLIILIMHFLLKNVMLDKDSKKPAYFEGWQDAECKPVQEDVVLPSNMCKVELADTEVKAPELKVKADCNIMQDKKNFMIIKEYEEPTTVSLDVSGYDNYDTYFQTYTSQCAENKN